jgi:hypothetical protein
MRFPGCPSCGHWVGHVARRSVARYDRFAPEPDVRSAALLTPKPTCYAPFTRAILAEAISSESLCDDATLLPFSQAFLQFVVCKRVPSRAAASHE